MTLIDLTTHTKKKSTFAVKLDVACEKQRSDVGQANKWAQQWGCENGGHVSLPHPPPTNTTASPLTTAQHCFV